MFRRVNEIGLSFPNGTASSQEVNLTDGAFGTIIVPTGSDLIGKTWNIYATSPNFADVKLMANDKTFAAGANSLNAGEIAECGAARTVKIKVGSNVSGAQTAYLLWKS